MLKKLLKILSLTLAVFLISAMAWVGYPFIYPSLETLKTEKNIKSAFMKRQQQQWQTSGKHRKIKQLWKPLSKISTFVVDAVLIAEDDKFWKHSGFDVEGIKYALKRNIKAGKIKAGGSSITQQLAKNLFLSSDKTVIRKIRETIYTWRIENTLGKRRILELYLNLAEWGDGIFGIEAAAWKYYKKPAISITPKEAARLASVLPNPKRYKPNGSSDYVKRRSAKIYKIMLKRDSSIAIYE